MLAFFSWEAKKRTEQKREVQKRRRTLGVSVSSVGEDKKNFSAPREKASEENAEEEDSGLGLFRGREQEKSEREEERDACVESF